MSLLEAIPKDTEVVDTPREYFLTRSAFPWFESISGNRGELIGPGVDDWMAIDVVDAGHDAFLEFVF